MMHLNDVFRRVSAFISEKQFSSAVYIVQSTNCIRIGDKATAGTEFHIELTYDPSAKFLYALNIYLREFEKVIQSRYNGNDDFSDGKWLEYTHITWGGAPSVRISFVRAEPPASDDGIWKDCVFDLLDACIEEYARFSRQNNQFTTSLADIDRRLVSLAKCTVQSQCTPNHLASGKHANEDICCSRQSAPSQ